MINPKVAPITFLPANCPRCTGKIKFPAPKNKPNNVILNNNDSQIVSFVFIKI